MPGDDPYARRGSGWVINQCAKALGISIILGSFLAIVNALAFAFLPHQLSRDPLPNDSAGTLFFAPYVGALVGLVCAPALALVMVSKEPRRGVIEVGAWTTLASIVGGAVEWLLVPPVIVYVLACVLWIVLKGRNTRVLRSGFCTSCGYSLAGLAADTCPECGSRFAP